MDGAWWGLNVSAALAALAAFAGGFALLRRARRIEDQPLSLIRSAAQGGVELQGRVRPMPGPAIVAPLSGVECVWWSYQVDSRGDDNRWCSVDCGTSDDLFYLSDPTGDCIVDPVGAEVIPSSTRRWRGNSPRPGSAPAPGLDTVLSFGRYRYREKMLRIGQPVYAQGWFRTQTAQQEFDEARELSALLAEWKRDRRKLLRRFDGSRDGVIDVQEWEAARRAALEELRARQVSSAADPDLNVLCQPPLGDRYLIAALPRHALALRYRLLALLCLSFAAVSGALVVYALLKHGVIS